MVELTGCSSGRQGAGDEEASAWASVVAVADPEGTTMSSVVAVAVADPVVAVGRRR